MERRIQIFNGDTVLEITEDRAVKTRYSRIGLTRRKKYLEDAIAKFTAQLAEVDAKLNIIHDEAASIK